MEKLKFVLGKPYKEVSGDQHNRKVDGDLGLKIKWLKVCRGIRDE